MNKKIKPFKGNLCSKHAEKMISIKLTEACNGHCSFCVDRGGHQLYNKNIDVEKIAKSAIKFHSYKKVIITGGEPFLEFDALRKLVELLRPYKKQIIVNTNGSLISPQKIMRLNYWIDELQISIHNPDEKINNEIFGFHFNPDIFGGQTYVHFDYLSYCLKYAKFDIAINTTFNKTCDKNFFTDMEKLAFNLPNVTKLRFTELKKVDETEFIDANCVIPNFINFKKLSDFLHRSSDELITDGCRLEFTNSNGIKISIKCLCDYAKGKNAESFSCCFINTDGQKKINVDTKNTFKVIYKDGSVYDDWIFHELR